MSSDGNTISKNTCEQNMDHGIYISQSSSNKIIDNTCTLNQNNGVYLYVADTTVIDNNKCTLNGINGLELYNSGLSTISNNTIYSNTNHGIYIRLSDLTVIKDTNCKFNKGDGVYINDCQLMNIIKNSFMYNGGYGITHIMGEHSNIRENNCSLNNLSGMYIWGQRVGYEQIPHGGLNILEENICTENNGSGITLVETNNNTLSRNLFLKNNEHGIENIGEGDAVNWLLAHNEYIENTCNLNSIDGIYFWNGSYNKIYNNSVSQNTQHGINFLYGLKNEVFNNDITNNVNGLNLYYIENTDIYDNICTQNDMNLYLENSSSNKIKNNNLSNGEYGAFIYLDSDSNTISGNTVLDNTNTGLLFSNKCNTNRIYHNNFITNTKQAEEIGSDLNFWNSNLEQGNYWSDYVGLDNGADGRDAGDGIGDTNLPHLSLDYYPFLNPFGWEYPGTPMLLDPGNYDQDGEFTINWTEPRNTIDYILEESTDALFSSSVVIYNGTDAHFNVTTSGEGIYYYRVRANNSERTGDWSNAESIEVNFPPELPENFSISALPEGNALNISWDPLNLPDVTEYYLYYKHTEFGTWYLLTVNDHPLNYFLHTGLLNGETYFYRLRVNDTYGHISIYSPVISGMPLDTEKPAPPTGLMIKEINIDSITIKWNASPELDVVGYNIYRSLVPNPDDWGDPINGLNLYYSTEYTDKELTEATTYYYVVTAVDEVPNVSNYSAVINGTTLLSEYGPEIKIAQDDFSMYEDSVDNSSINLFDWFMDRNSDPLHFECKGQTYIDVQITDATGEVILTPEQDWNGKETLAFFAYDRDVYTHDEVTVTVIPVNDPPGQALIINPLDGHEVNDSTSITFEGRCSDIDLPSQDVHTYQWSSNISGDLGTGKILVKTIKQTGFHQIRLTVTDSGDLQSNATLNIQITKSLVIEPPDKPDQNETDDDDDDEPEDEGFDWFLVIYLLSGIIILILVIMIFSSLHKKPEKKEVAEVVSEEAEDVEDIDLGADMADEEDLAETEEPELVEKTMEAEEVDAELEDELPEDVD
jgi:parallel beta-helix repeat protein